MKPGFLPASFPGRVCCVLTILCLGIVLVAAADEPLTAEQKERLKERDRLQAQAAALRQQGKFAEAIEAAQKMLAIERAIFGDVHEEVAGSLKMLGDLHSAREDFPAARKVLEEALALRKKLHGDTHWRVTDARWRLKDAELMGRLEPAQRLRLKEARHKNAQVIQALEQGKYSEAVPLAKEIAAVHREILGENHPDHATCLNNLASLYQEMGDHAQALPLLEQAAAVARAALGERHPDYAVGLNNLAELHRDRGDFWQARPLLEQARDTLRAAFGEKHPQYITSLNNVGMLYQQMGAYERARSLLEQARDLSQEVEGEKSAVFALRLHNLGMLYQQTGDYERALPLFEQAYELWRTTLRDEHPVLANSLGSLGILHQYLGDYARARSLLAQALRIRKAILGEKHPGYALALNNLAALHRSAREYDQARRLYEEALDILRATVGEKHPDFTTGLSNLAVLYGALGEPERARPLAEQVLAVRRATLGETHPLYAKSLNILGRIYQDLGDYERARPRMEQSRDLRRASFGEKHPEFADSLRNLALLHLACGERAQAEPLLRQALAIAHEHLGRTFGVLSDRQRLDFLGELRGSLDSYLSTTAPPDARASVMYEQVLAWKGAAAARQAEERLVLDRPELRLLLEELRAARAGLAALAAQPAAPPGQQAWLKRFDELETRKEAVEVKLAQASAEYHRMRQRRRPTADRLAQALPSGAALVDLIEYVHFTPDAEKKGRWHLERRLAAFVMVREREPVYVPLGSAEVIERAARAWRHPVGADSPGLPDAAAAGELARLVWQPLQKHLGGVTTVLVAPDGALCGLPLAALPGSKPGSYLLEEYAIGHVTSGQHLLELIEEPPARGSDGLLALGDAAYGEPLHGPEPADCPSRRFPRWSSLPGTGLEVDRIVPLYRRAFATGRAPQLLRGADADRVRLQRELAASPPAPPWRYLHLATHGFFDPPRAPGGLQAGDRPFDELRAEVMFIRNPLLVSGLVLAGGNRPDGAGLLTAEEVASLDLRGCELAVLSACETALGRQAGLEGVLGLQRAFQTAGARTLIASLWKVDDAATSLLMEEFYTNLWQRKLPKLEALRQAQIFVLKNPNLMAGRRKLLGDELAKRGLKTEQSKPLPDGGKVQGRTHPAFWAAFVLSGDYR